MAQFNLTDPIHIQVEKAVRKLLSEQNGDPYSSTNGCFDRRFWSWKLVDFPEATYQQSVYPLALMLSHPESSYFRSPVVRKAVVAGLKYAVSIQHRNGSFDQAFPNEYSFGATSFLLHPLLEAYKIVQRDFDEKMNRCIESSLHQAAEFLYSHEEKHGHIANHLAGAVLSLLVSAEHFTETRYRQRAELFLEKILENQSSEGWFLEYEGADPGYQTLCLYYLSQIRRKMYSKKLEKALKIAIDFIAYFVHPDGTFGGEYGSRRTEIYYPGGLALLGSEFPMAGSITQSMCHSISKGTTVNLCDADMGNLAPLLSNYVCALQSGILEEERKAQPLPYEQPEVKQDFPKAGLHVRGMKHYYAVLGISNGGVLKVFDKKQRRLLWDDCGYVGKMSNGKFVTTQMTILNRPCRVTEVEAMLTAGFYEILDSTPTPFRFILLRLLNLTLMRSVCLGNIVKKSLVRLLIRKKRKFPLILKRRVEFTDARVVIKDRLTKSQHVRLDWLDLGRKFVSIHMASSRYFNGHQLNQSCPTSKVDVKILNQKQYLDMQFLIEPPGA